MGREMSRELLEQLLDNDLLEKHAKDLDDVFLRRHLWNLMQLRWTRSLAARKAEWWEIKKGVLEDMRTGKVPKSSIDTP